MNPTLAITVDRTTLRLSDTIPVVVAIEGTAPLRVELPDALLMGPSAEIWRVVPDGAARTEMLPDRRERWTQKYNCSPFQPGKGLPLEFQPFRVKAGPAVEAVPLTGKPLIFTVETDLLGAKAEDAHPATGIEQLPPLPVAPIGLPAVWAVGGAAILVALAAVFATVRRRRVVSVVPPAEEALAALADGELPLDRVSEVVRRFLRRGFGWPTESATTVELLTILTEHSGWSAERVEEVSGILSACDRAKFANGPADVETATETRERARAWVADIGVTS